VNIQIEADDKLVAKAMEATGARTKEELIEMALKEIVAKRLQGGRPKRKGLFELAGKIDFYEGFDPKELRKDRDFSD